MNRKEAIETLRENYCAMCAFGSQNIDTCTIRECDTRTALNMIFEELEKLNKIYRVIDDWNSASSDECHLCRIQQVLDGVDKRCNESETK